MKIITATPSTLKINAIKEAFETQFPNQKINISGHDVSSEVSAQPQTFEETLTGAWNRLQNLKQIIEEDFDYLVSYEGGICTFPYLTEFIGLGIAIVQDKNGTINYSVNNELTFPKDFVNKTIELKTDMSALLKSEYGVEDGDVIKYFSKGKLTRQEIITKHVKNALEKFF